MQFLKLFTPIFIALFLIVSDHKFSYLDNAKQSIVTLISPIYLVVGLPAQLFVWINEQGSTEEMLLNKNKQLNNELIFLKANLQTYNALLLENQKLSELLGLSYQLSHQVFVLARVNSIAQSRLKKQIIINKGLDDGLKIGQIVLGAHGVIGQLTQLTSSHSTVLMITDPTQHTPVKNQRNGVRGVSKGMAANQAGLIVNFIENGLDIKIGDIFVSSAVGSKFPAGFPVGKVTHIERHANDPFLHIELTPIQTTKQLEFVLISDSI